MKKKFISPYFFSHHVLLIIALCFYFFSSIIHAEIQKVTNDISLSGQFIQGGVVFGKTVPGSQIIFDNQIIRLSSSGSFVIGFNRDEPEIVSLQVTTPDGITHSKNIIVKMREYKVQRINGLAKSKVSPGRSDVLDRIKKEGAQVAQARKRNDARLDFMEHFIWPAKGPISGVYGSQRILNGQPKQPHFGVDVAAPLGSNVVAPASGIVTLAHSDMFYSGGTIILDHGHGLSSTFLHLSQLLVKTGERVKQGDLIAKVGATGRVTGAHLDWRMNLFKRRVDPQLLVSPRNNINN